MMHLVFALHCEAKPFIARLELARNAALRAFPVFEGGGWRLAVSGPGKTAAAAATAFLLSTPAPDAAPWLVNIGICGAAKGTAPPGTTVLAHKLLEEDSGRTFFPDMLWRHPFREGTVTTASRVIEDGTAAPGPYVDMEATGVFEAAGFFLPPDRIAVVKVVSDVLGMGTPTAREVTALMDRAAPEILSWLTALAEQTPEGAFAFAPDEEAALEEACGCLRLSATMRSELRALARFHRLGGGDLLSALAPFREGPEGSKKEGKTRFARLRQTLAQSEI